MLELALGAMTGNVDGFLVSVFVIVAAAVALAAGAGYFIYWLFKKFCGRKQP